MAGQLYFARMPGVTADMFCMDSISKNKPMSATEHPGQGGLGR